MSDQRKPKRFDFLEDKKSPDPSDHPGMPQVGRFEHLEIGQIRKPLTLKPKPEAQDPAAKGPQQEITLVIDGLTYSSTDPGLPADIRVLMDRIRTEEPRTRCSGP